MSLSQLIRATYNNSVTEVSNTGALVTAVGISGALGIVVRRAAAADPQAAFLSIFTITGQVLLTSLQGIRTVIQAGGASNIQFRLHGAADTVISAATATTATDAVGTVYSITGNFGDNVLIGAGGVGGSVPVQGGIAGGPTTAEQYQKGILINGGSIQVEFSAAGATGSTAYIATYIPLSVGATLVAA